MPGAGDHGIWLLLPIPPSVAVSGGCPEARRGGRPEVAGAELGIPIPPMGGECAGGGDQAGGGAEAGNAED